MATCVSYAMYAVKSSSPPYREMLWKIGLGQNICVHADRCSDASLRANDQALLLLCCSIGMTATPCSDGSIRAVESAKCLVSHPYHLGPQKHKH